MKLIPYLSVIFILCTFSSLGQNKKLKAYLDEKQFYAPEIGNYIEIQLQYVGYTLNYITVPSGIQSEIAVIIKISDQDSIVSMDGFRLQSPIMRDSLIDDFYDIRRFALKPGKYVLSLEISDIHSTNLPIKISKPIEIKDFSTNVGFSDIEIAETATKGDGTSVFFKSGYDIIPKFSNYFPNELNYLPIYFELYNTLSLKQDALGIKQKIINTITGEEIPQYTIANKIKPDQVVPFTRAIDLQNLPSGKYSLIYTLISKEMVVLDSIDYEFERSSNVDNNFDPEKIILNPAFQESISKDSVMFYLASLIPMAKPAEIKNILNIIKLNNEENGRKLIQGFWIKTSNANAYQDWMKYKSQVLFVEKLYRNNFQAGYETDRGRVYLQYGPPSSIIQKENSANEYPYEIWQYNKIGKYSNKRFVFYNPDIVSTTYRLLHSDMIGEIKNLSWQQVLSSRNAPNGTIDNQNNNGNSGFGNSNNYYRQY
ncbi:MAG: GWxTD domain-containing protein [Flavobacteriia bacterium]|nr:GWxTD domain-containing protein [Flavobacteriia bacterium]